MAALEVVRNMREVLSKRRSISTRHEIEFTFSAPKAKKVCLAGDFNDWNVKSMPMKKDAGGTWRIRLKLASGRYEFKYVVDGIWAQDMSCSGTAPNSFGSCNNVIGIA